jgi:hypothetical protein
MSLKESFLEIWWVVKTCLTTIWFWVPILVGVYVSFEIWLFIFVHPLSILIAPVLIAIYAVTIQDKRARSQFGLLRARRLDAKHPIGTGPEFIAEWNAQDRVEEYLRLLEDEKKQANKK